MSSNNSTTLAAAVAFGLVGLTGLYITNAKQKIEEREREMFQLEAQRNHLEREKEREEERQKIEQSKEERKAEMKRGSEYVELVIAREENSNKHILGKVLIRLHTDRVPNTCENFRQLIAGRRYNKCPFHRVIQGFMIQGGDITKGDGTGGDSIFGPTFPDENLEFAHERPGLLSMANAGPDTNNSQFFITTVATPHLDGKHVVFGEVIEGMEFVYSVEREMTDGNDRPLRHCYIDTARVIEKPIIKQQQQQQERVTEEIGVADNNEGFQGSYYRQQGGGSGEGDMQHLYQLQNSEKLRMGHSDRNGGSEVNDVRRSTDIGDLPNQPGFGDMMGMGDTENGEPSALQAPIPHANPDFGSPL